MTMSLDLAIVLFLLGATIVMFAMNRPRMDVVALLMMILLPLTGIVSVSEALAGLSDPNIILIAALFIIGEGLVRTGVAQKLGDALVRGAGQSEVRLIVFLMIVVAGLGSVMSSTGVVAIFIPVVLRIARNAGIPVSRLMMPLSVAALISGMMTLIATPPNLVVQSQLVRAGYEGFHFFSFARFGLPVLAVAIAYMLLARRLFARAKTPDETTLRRRPRLSQWVDEYGLGKREVRLRLTGHSIWAGQRLDQLEFRSTFGMNILAIERQRRFSPVIVEPSAQTVLRVGDVLFVDFREPPEDLDEFCARHGLLALPIEADYFTDRSHAVGMAEIMIPAESNLLGKTPVTTNFRSIYGLSVVGIKRGDSPIVSDVQDERLRLGDTLLVAGPWKAIAGLRTDPKELIVLHVPVEFDDVVAAPSRAPFAVATLLLVIGLMVTGIVPNVLAVLVGCMLMGLFRCVDIDGAYRAIQWPTIFLIVGMMPFSIALQKTGGVDLAVNTLLHAVGEVNPTIVLITLFSITALLGLFISNTATAVLMAPVAIAFATELGQSPHAFAMTVVLASSSAFMTPVSSPVNVLVLGPGNYRFMDFVRVGVPLFLVVMTISVFFVRITFP